jgi:hypothetical protein
LYIIQGIIRSPRLALFRPIQRVERFHVIPAQPLQGVQALGQAGEMLAALEKSNGGRPGNLERYVPSLSAYAQAYEEAQLTRQMASFWQRVAAIPEDEWEAYQDECLATGAAVRLSACQDLTGGARPPPGWPAIAPGRPLARFGRPPVVALAGRASGGARTISRNKRH